MFKLYKKFSKLDYLLIVIIIGFTILQVYCTMLMTDYIRDITLVINTISYQNLGEVPVIYSTSDILYNFGMILLVSVGSGLCQIVTEVLASKVTADLTTKVRTELNDKIMDFSLAEINKFQTASLITRTTNDIEQVTITTLLLLRMVFAAPVTAIWAICKVQATSNYLMAVDIVFIVLMCLALILIMALVLPKFKIMQKKIDRLNSLTQENLTGIRVVRAFNAEKYQDDKFAIANKDLTRTQLFTGRVIALMSPIMTIIMNGLTLTIYYVGTLLINDVSSNVNFETVNAFITLGNQIILSFMMLLMMFILWPRASASAKRINEVLETESSIKDPEVEKTPVGKGEIEFKDVSFKYPDAEEDVIEHISFKANKGDTIAFIGSTGSGKSSLVNLVTRLYDVTQGEIIIDGNNIKDYKQSTLRKIVGFVPQKAVLFSGTVEDNIALNEKEKIDENKCKKAASIALADEFIEKMEDGYKSSIAQGGTNVSGGQRQRLCIARAIYQEPEIFVFDDSFSALDFKTDKTVRDNLAKEEKDATKLIVAQRIGTIMDADQIIVLADGKMVGLGKHKELLESCPTYRDIALSQLSKEELGL